MSHETVPRNLGIQRQDLAEFGFTANCAKCQHILLGAGGRSNMAHSDECRQRIYADMGTRPLEREKLERARRRIKEHKEHRTVHSNVRREPGASVPVPEPPAPAAPTPGGPENTALPLYHRMMAGLAGMGQVVVV